jgi:hypothetical protein
VPTTEEDIDDLRQHESYPFTVTRRPNQKTYPGNQVRPKNRKRWFSLLLLRFSSSPIGFVT